MNEVCRRDVSATECNRFVPKIAKIELGKDMEIDFQPSKSRLGINILAAENSGVIRMKDVVRVARRKFQKIGKVCT